MTVTGSVTWREPGKLGTLATAQLGDYYAAVWENPEAYNPAAAFVWVVARNGTEWPVPEGDADSMEVAQVRAAECLVERALADGGPGHGVLDDRVRRATQELHTTYTLAREGRLQTGRDAAYQRAEGIAWSLGLFTDTPMKEWLDRADAAYRAGDSDG